MMTIFMLKWKVKRDFGLLFLFSNGPICSSDTLLYYSHFEVGFLFAEIFEFEAGFRRTYIKSLPSYLFL
jgi:hypothetical protein